MTMLDPGTGMAIGRVSVMDRQHSGRFTTLYLSIDARDSKSPLVKKVYWMHEDPITMDPERIKVMPDQLKLGERIHVTWNEVSRIISIELIGHRCVMDHIREVDAA